MLTKKQTTLLELIEIGRKEEITTFLSTQFANPQEIRDFLNTPIPIFQEPKNTTTNYTFVNYCIGQARDSDSFKAYSEIAGILMENGANGRIKDEKGRDYLKYKELIRKAIEQGSSTRVHGEPLSPPNSTSPNRDDSGAGAAPLGTAKNTDKAAGQ